MGALEVGTGVIVNMGVAGRMVGLGRREGAVGFVVRVVCVVGVRCVVVSGDGMAVRG